MSQPTAMRPSPDFSLPLDIAVLAGFSILALAVASWRFSREAAYEPMIRLLARRN
jgi:hypothetical protein